MTDPVLCAEDLQIGIEGTDIRLVDGVSFEVQKGETFALVGESGCGKSLTALAIMGLLPARLVVGGQLCFNGSNLTTISARHMRDIRGKSIAMIFQDPMSALNPVMSVGSQIAEAVRMDPVVSSSEARDRAIALMREVMIPDPVRRFSEYPHQMSGGMSQRVVIAMALARQPDLLVADEPTTALDVTVQAQVLGVLDHIRDTRGLSVILITHDLGVVRDHAKRVAVMYSGSIVEEGDVDTVLMSPSHHYTAGLLRTRPHGSHLTGARLLEIPGTVPLPAQRPEGCAFQPRCPAAGGRCESDRPGRRTLGAGHSVRCYYPASGTIQ